MEVILKKNVSKLGYTNDIVKVKPGYGRNFLIPQGYAVLATASAKKAHAEVLKQKSHKEEKLLSEAQGIAEKIGNLKILWFLDLSIKVHASEKVTFSNLNVFVLFNWE